MTDDSGDYVGGSLPARFVAGGAMGGAASLAGVVVGGLVSRVIGGAELDFWFTDWAHVLLILGIAPSAAFGSWVVWRGNGQRPGAGVSGLVGASLASFVGGWIGLVVGDVVIEPGPGLPWIMGLAVVGGNVAYVVGVGWKGRGGG